MPCGFELPHRVLEDVLRLVGFQDKHRCEQVCRDWRDLVRTELAPKMITVRLVQTTSAPEHIRVRLVPWRAHDYNPLADQTADIPEFTVSVGHSSPDLPSIFHSFVAWLSRRTAGLVDLVLHTGECQLPCVQLFDQLASGLSLQADASFHIRTLCTPFVLTEKLQTVLCMVAAQQTAQETLACACAASKILSLPRCQSLAYSLTSLTTHITNPLQDLQHVPSLTSLTRLQLSLNSAKASQLAALDQMTAQITQITGLKALRMHDFPHSSTNSISQGLPNLQELVLRGFGPVLDVQHCTQLTSLTVADDTDVSGLRQVDLPVEQTCCLEKLSLRISSGCALSNLGDALRLSSLAFYDHCPSNLIKLSSISSSTSTNSSFAGPWPPLPSLYSLRIGYLPCAPPVVWTEYACLCELNLTYCHPRLPAWFADLTLLKKLTLFSRSLKEFPSSVLKLTQLEEICLGLMVFPKDIVEFAFFLHLSRLTLMVHDTVGGPGHDIINACLPVFQESVYVLQAALLKRLPNAAIKMAVDGQKWSFSQTL